MMGMMEMTLKNYEGKKIYIILRSNRVYSGKCVEVSYLGQDTDDSPIFLFTIIDKFDKYVSFLNKEIKIIEEEKDKIKEEKEDGNKE